MARKDEIIREIRRVAEKVKPDPLTQTAFQREGTISVSNLRYHFESFNEAVRAAGLQPNTKNIPATGYKSLDQSELLEVIGDLWRATGKRPTESLMNSKGKFSVRPYRKRWGSLRKAVDEYIRQHGVPSAASSTELLSPIRRPNPSAAISPIRPAPTHTPPGGAGNRQPIVYGSPIDFRGLRYAPTNEQGVVYLFGMVSKELGFLVESIRTEYPDCEGKRMLGTSGTQWQHVRIEFEYKSSNFVRHGHDPDGCDLIVCWIHDWEASPVEILELRSAIEQLAAE